MSEPFSDQPSVLEQQLRFHPFSKGLGDGDAAALASFGHLAAFETRDVIFEAGSPADYFYLVRTGVVALEVTSSTGRPQRIQSISEGSVLGWSWLFPPYEWQFRAVAQTPVRAIALDGAALRDYCEENPALGLRLVRRIAEVMADRLHASRRRISTF
jgi:CRP-like cAMP-binding protein